MSKSEIQMSDFDIAKRLIKPMENEHFWRWSAGNKVGDAYIFENVAKTLLKNTLSDMSKSEIQMSDFEIA